MALNLDIHPHLAVQGVFEALSAFIVFTAPQAQG